MVKYGKYITWTPDPHPRDLVEQFFPVDSTCTFCTGIYIMDRQMCMLDCLYRNMYTHTDIYSAIASWLLSPTVDCFEYMHDIVHWS